MSINFSPALTIRVYDWSQWKLVQSQKSLLTQYDDSEDRYLIYGYDGPEAHTTTIYKGAVPPGFDQAQNDLDKADFEAKYKPTANQSVVPRTSDGKTIQLINQFPGDVIPYFAGAGDDAVTGRGKGTPFVASSDAAGDTIVEFGFIDWLYIAGGALAVLAGDIGDWIDYLIYAPATAVVSNPGLGNCNLVDPGVGAPILIVPAVGGAFDVNLATADPVTAHDSMDNPTGFYNWSGPDTGSGVITPGVPQKSEFNLYTIPVDLAKYVARAPLLDTTLFDLNFPVKPKKLLPQWKHRVTLHNGGHVGLKTSWLLTTARKKTS